MKQLAKCYVALAAPSGGGKTTLCRMLLKKYPETCLSISFTSRSPRGGEKEGQDYHFVSEAHFQDLIKQGDLVEWAKVHGCFYGTSKRFLEDKSAQGKVVLLDIDVQGVDSLKRIFGNKCLSVFILPPSMQELEARLRSRSTESEEKLQVRLKNAREEISRAPDFDHQLVNKDLEDTFAALCEIVEREVGLGK